MIILGPAARHWQVTVAAVRAAAAAPPRAGDEQLDSLLELSHCNPFQKPVENVAYNSQRPHPAIRTGLIIPKMSLVRSAGARVGGRSDKGTDFDFERHGGDGRRSSRQPSPRSLFREVHQNKIDSEKEIQTIERKKKNWQDSSSLRLDVSTS